LHVAAGVAYDEHQAYATPVALLTALAPVGGVSRGPAERSP
jgi:hypothetical protein